MEDGNIVTVHHIGLSLFERLKKSGVGYETIRYDGFVRYETRCVAIGLDNGNNLNSFFSFFIKSEGRYAVYDNNSKISKEEVLRILDEVLLEESIEAI